MFKEIKYFLLLHVLPPVIYLIMNVIKATSKIEHINRARLDQYLERGQNFIVCFWHGRLLMMPFARLRKKGKVMISRHRDGEFIARVIKYFGLDSIRGSFRKKSVSSIREIISSLEEGFDVAITPDGPKGPGFKVKKGIIELARLTNTPILPVTFSACKKKPLIPGIDFYCPCPLQE